MTTNSTRSDSEHSPILTKHNDNLYTVGNYRVEYYIGEWYLNGTQIESVRSDDRDTLIKIACYLTNVEQQADLIRQMFLMAQGEANDRR